MMNSNHPMSIGEGNNYFEAFKRIRNGIGKYDAREIVLGCLQRLHAKEAETIQNMQRQPPWNQLLLIKWAVVYGDFTSNGKRTLTQQDLNGLLNSITNIGGSVPLPQTVNHPLVLLRAIGYQQFWHQEIRHPIALLRQGILFGKLDRSHSFQRWFEEETSVSLDNFIDLSFMVYARFCEPDIHFIHEAFFQPVAASFPPACVANFLQATSRTPVQLREYLVGLETESHEPSEYYERTPLVRFPFLDLGGRYFYYSFKVLMHSLANFAYDTLRQRDPQAFMEKFGRIFEDYVLLGIASTGVRFYDEEALRRFVQRDSHVVDGLVLDADVNVFVEAKGVEVGHLGMTSYRPGDVTNAVKSSVIKGISQGMDVVRVLTKLNSLPGGNLTRSRNFLLLVTYKDLFLGTGQDFYESFGGVRLESALGCAMQDAPIPLDQIYIVSIDEFDYLIACIASGKSSFSQVFGHAYQKDSDPNTKRLNLIQHLKEMCGDVDVPQYLKAERDYRLTSISERLPEEQRTTD